MVLVDCSLGNNPDSLFLFETRAAANVGDLVRELVLVHNRRLQVLRLVAHVRLLAKHGRLRPEKDRGLTAEQIAKGSVDEQKDPHMDPTGQRDGKPPVEQAARTLERTASEAEAAVSSKQAAAGKPMTMAFIEEFVQNIKGAVMIAFPQGLPDYDPVAQILAGREDLAGRADSLEVLDPATAVLWFAGKKLAREDALEKYIGRNEKTRIKAKLARPEQGAPQRTSAVDEETRKRMVALYHKREAERRRLEEEADETPAAGEWANPNAFRQSVAGFGGGVNFKLV